MPRPQSCRRVSGVPEAIYFKPRGIPTFQLEEVVLTLDEFEAVRLADFEKLYQEAAAERMKISRQTFGRIIDSARGKIADALLNGKALKIEGGNVSFPRGGHGRRRRCRGIPEGEESPNKTVPDAFQDEALKSGISRNAELQNELQDKEKEQ